MVCLSISDWEKDLWMWNEVLHQSEDEGSHVWQFHQECSNLQMNDTQDILLLMKKNLQSVQTQIMKYDNKD